MTIKTKSPIRLWAGLQFRSLAAYLAVTLLAFAVSTAPAQERTGNIAGVVKDQSGGVLPGVAITLTHKETGRTTTTKTDTNGSYIARDLEPGRYTIKFELTGFSNSVFQDVIVMLGKTVDVNTTMQIGAVEQVVEVTGGATLIDTLSTTVAHNVTAEEFDRLPKPRSFQGLALLSPSVNTGEIEGGFQVNGASAAENNYYIDGVSTNSAIDGRARQNAVFEYLQEVQVKTAGLDAEYGGALGGVVSAVTKSGGNDFHGEIHYYYYGNKLSAGPTERLTLDPVTERSIAYIQDEKQKRDWQEFGGSLGGPILKDKLWFFTSASPRWHRGSQQALFNNGTEPGTINRKAYKMNWFNKISFDPAQRVRTNFTWLYTPEYLEGSLPAYDGFAPNVVVRSLASAQGGATRGYTQPEQSYTGTVDLTLSSRSLLSFKAGRYYLNYKETGIPYTKYYWWQASSVGLPGVPPELQKPFNYVTPSGAQTLHDLTTRTYGQVDFSQIFRFGGTHNLKAGTGLQKNANNINDSWNGPDGRVQLFWDLSFRGDRGQYGYYSVDDASTKGSIGANIIHLYVQDSWRIHPRLTLNLGIRTEKETIPSFQRNIQDYAFRFNFGDKIGPRLGASFDLLGNGKVKVYGGWGRYYDWTKFDLARGTFGADIWRVYYRSLDTLDVYKIDLNNMPGRNLWPGVYRDRRVPGFQYLDKEVKPMSADVLNLGVEYEVRPQMVFSGRYVRNYLNRTIEDMGALDAEGNEVYRYGNPGQGANTIFPSSGATCVVKVGTACGFPMPEARRTYDAMELSLTRRFGGGWLGSASYVFSRLSGNYGGLQSTDEIRPPTLGYGFGPNQIFGAENFRPGGNANRYFDLDEAMWDAHGEVGLFGRLPTDRPHVFKLYGAKQFRFGFEVGGFFRLSSGTPVTTQVVTVNDIPFYVEGRGDYGRTPVFNQTDLMVAHEVKLGEVKRMRFELNITNLFNQKTSMFTFDRYNREEHSDSAGIDLSSTDLSKGFDWKAMVAATPDGPNAVDPRFGKAAIYNAGFGGRFLVKFIF